MTTYKTIEDARQKTGSSVTVIIKIRTSSDDTVYIGAKCGIKTLNKMGAIDGIAEMIAEYDVVENRNPHTGPCPYCGTYCNGDCRAR